MMEVEGANMSGCHVPESRRLDELDNDIRYLTKEKIILEKRIDALENFINKHWSSKRHEPHKCPICNGKGFITETVEYLRIKDVSCNACEAKGIVWG